MSRISQYPIVKEDVQLRRGDEDQGKFYCNYNNKTKKNKILYCGHS